METVNQNTANRSPLTANSVWERMISFISPSTAFRRMQSRYAIETFAGERSYFGAAKGRRTANWLAPSSSAVTEIQSALTFLRNRSRDLTRNNAYAKKAVTEIANNIVGTGINQP
jgi:capsid protein